MDKRILVIEDNAAFRKILNIRLKAEGYETLLAEDGLTGLSMARKELPDLVITDLSMPKMTGLELLKEVRADANMADVPFIMVTAEAQQDNIILAVKAKVSQYIVKPFTAETLGEKIDKIFS